MDKLKISSSAEQIVKDIFTYSKSQKKSWQRIPILALEADGRIGYSEQYSRAYEHGFWALNSSIQNGCYSIYVDLDTGNLINPHSIELSSRMLDANKESVLNLAFNLDELDTKKIITSLEKKSKESYSLTYNPKEQEAWRMRVIKKLGLTEFYTRKNS